MNNSYYDILGLKMNCTKEEIKKKYRKLSLKYHPDRPDGNKEMFQKISTAHEVLNNIQERAAYDRNLKGINNRPSMKSDFPDMDYLNKMFNMNNMNNMNNNRHFINAFNLNINKQIILTLNECWLGATKQILIERLIYRNNSKIMQTESVIVRIPAGVSNGSKIIMKGKGNIHNTGISGDVNIHITINNNTEYLRDGLDLILKKEISFKESLVGFKFEIKHISGKKYSINNFDGKIIEDGYLKIVQNLGFHKQMNNIKKQGI